MRGRRLSVWTGAIIAALTAVAPASSQTQQTRPTLTRPPVATRVAPPTTTAPTGGVNWQEAVTFSRRSANAGPALSKGLPQEALDRTRVPILLPADAALMEGARLYSFGDHYTLSADIPGGGVSLTGTTATVSVPSKLAVAPVGPTQLVLQRTVDGHLASFTRFGVLYTVEVRCDSPKDERCRTDAFVKALTAKTTVVVLGKAARQAAGLGG